MQMEGKRRLQGLPRRYTVRSPPPLVMARTLTTIQGTWDAFRSIYRQAGLAGLWKGCVPNVQVWLQWGILCTDCASSAPHWSTSET
jgi:hypothetical protein